MLKILFFSSAIIANERLLSFQYKCLWNYILIKMFLCFFKVKIEGVLY